MRVAVLGLGQMGTPIAQRLKDAGHELSVWNRSPPATSDFVRQGAAQLQRPADVFTHAEMAITMLADDAAVEAVTVGNHGILRGEGSGLLVDMSTISARTSAQIAAACAERGVTYLRAPVSGNPSVVVAGNLGIIVSGPQDAFNAAADTLRAIGPKLFYVGAEEQSRILKLALNLMIGGTTQLLAEALVLSERHGLERAKVLEVVAGSAIGSPFVKYKTAPLIADDYTSTFTARLMYKDLALALQAGHDASVPLPLTAATQQLVEGCIGTGMGDLDLSALVPRLLREAGS